MTTTERKWAERVRAWRSSGLSAREFTRGRDFTAGGLYHSAHVLRKRGLASPTAKAAPRVRLARVGRVASAAPAPLVVAVGAARLCVPPGFDEATLRAALGALLDAVAGAAE